MSFIETLESQLTFINQQMSPYPPNPQITSNWGLCARSSTLTETYSASYLNNVAHSIGSLSDHGYSVLR